MTTSSDQMPALPEMPKSRLDSLSPEEKVRIATTMRFLVDLKTLYNEGLQIGSDMLEGKTPAQEIGVKLMDFERNLRVASNEMLKRPLKVAHAVALRTGETKLDDGPWLTKVRARASEARTAREEKAREDRFKAIAVSPVDDGVQDEPDGGPRP